MTRFADFLATFLRGVFTFLFGVRPRNTRPASASHLSPSPVELLESRIAPASLVSVTAGNLLVQDTENADDTLTISLVGGFFQISDPAGITAADPDDQLDANTVAIDATTVTGNFTILTGVGDDSVSFNSDLAIPGTLRIDTGTGVDQVGDLPGITANALTINTNSALTQTGALEIAHLTNLTVGANAITLDNAANKFGGAVALSNSGANHVVLSNLGALELGNVSVGSGNLTVEAIGITQSVGASIVQAPAAGVASFAAGAGVIALGNAHNVWTGSVALSNSGANNVSLGSDAALVFEASNLGSGTLTVIAAGISQNGAITQASGAGAVSFSGTSGAINLGLANEFNGAVSASTTGTAASITLHNEDASLLVSSVTTLDGDVNLSVTEGDLTVLSLSAAGSVDLTTVGTGDVFIDQITATGAVIEITALGEISEVGVGDVGVDLIATNAVLTAGTGIGAGNALETSLVKLEGATVTGGIQIHETDGLTIGGYSVLNGLVVSSSGEIVLTSGALTMVGDISSPDTVMVSSSGAIVQTSGAFKNVLLLTTSSVGGQTLKGDNTVVAFTGVNTGSGHVELTNRFDGLALGDISNSSGGKITVANLDGAMTVSGAIASGGTLGGAISLSAEGQLVVASTATVSSAGGSGGSLSVVDGVSFEGAVTLGAGNIALAGGAGAMTIAAPISVGHSFTLRATGDINILAKVETTGLLTNLSVLADSDLDGSGGVYFGSDASEGWLKAGRDLDVRGSEYSGSFVPAFGAAGGSVIIASNGASPRLEAVGSITIATHAAAPANTEIWLGGLVHSSASGTLYLESALRVISDEAYLQTNGGGSVLFLGTVNGAYNLHVSTGVGVVQFGGAVGNDQALQEVLVDSAYQFAALSTFEARSLTLSSVTTSAEFTGAIVLNGTGTSFSVNAATVTLHDSVAATGGGDIVLETDNITFEGSVSGSGGLILSPKTLSRSIGLNGIGDFNLSSAELDLFEDGFDHIQIGDSSGSGTITTEGATFRDSVRILAPHSGSLATVNGALVGIGDASIAIEARAIRLNVASPTAALSSGSGDLEIIGNVTLQKNTLLTTDGSITQSGWINGAFSLTATAGDAIVFHGGVGAPNGSSIGGAKALTSISLTADTLSLQPRTITSGAQTYTGTTLITLRDGGFRSTLAGPITFNGPVETRLTISIATAGGLGDDVIFNGPVNAADDRPGGLSINAGLADVRFTGEIGGVEPLKTLAVNAATNVTLTASAEVLSTAAITARNAVNFGGHFAVSAPKGTLTVTADSFHTSGEMEVTGDLTVIANEIDFAGGAESVSGNGDLRLRPRETLIPIMVGGPVGIVPGQLDLDETDLAALADGFNSIYIGKSTGLGAMTVAAGVSFSDPVTLEVSNTKSTITALGSITGTGNASVTLRSHETHLGEAVTTSGGDIYLRNAILHSDSVVASGGGDITFYGRVKTPDSAFNLALAADGGDIRVLHGIGTAIAPAGDVAAESSGTTSLFGGVTASSLTTDAGGSALLSGAIVLKGGELQIAEPVTLNGSTSVKTSNNVTFGGTIDGTAKRASSLTISAGEGAVTLGGTIGGSHAIGQFKVSSLDTITAGDITASGLTWKGAILSASNVLTATGTQSYTGGVSSVGGSTLTGNLTGKNLTISTTTAIENHGTWSFSGAVSLKTASGNSITVTGPDNVLGTLALSGGSAVIENNTATVLKTVSLQGAFNLSSNGAVSQLSTVRVHELQIEASGTIDLSRTGNRFWSLDGIEANGAIKLISGGHNLTFNSPITTTDGDVVIAANGAGSHYQIINLVDDDAITISTLVGGPYYYTLYSFDQSLTQLGDLAPVVGTFAIRYPAGLPATQNEIHFMQV